MQKARFGYYGLVVQPTFDEVLDQTKKPLRIPLPDRKAKREALGFYRAKLLQQQQLATGYEVFLLEHALSDETVPGNVIQVAPSKSADDAIWENMTQHAQAHWENKKEQALRHRVGRQRGYVADGSGTKECLVRRLLPGQRQFHSTRGGPSGHALHERFRTGACARLPARETDPQGGAAQLAPIYRVSCPAGIPHLPSTESGPGAAEWRRGWEIDSQDGRQLRVRTSGLGGRRMNCCIGKHVCSRISHRSRRQTCWRVCRTTYPKHPRQSWIVSRIAVRIPRLQVLWSQMAPKPAGSGLGGMTSSTLLQFASCTR